jgi:hypothetical protein
MSNENKAPNNVLQFPGPKTTSNKPAHNPPPVPNASEPPKPEKTKSVKKTTAGTVLAIALMSVAVNKYTFSHHSNSADLSSNGGRSIASVERLTFHRDAAWEKALAERLASAKTRDIASVNIGRAATKDEKLRWGVLEEKYTISYDADEHNIRSILLQDEKSSPSYLLDRPKFLNEFGSLFSAHFETAKLKSVQKSDDKTVEAYTLFDKDNNPKGEARFELDRHKRLISLKVEPVKI